MVGLVALWSHLLAAALYGALAIWQLRRWNDAPRQRPLVTAFAVVSVWSIFMAMLGPWHILSELADSGRHLAFLAFMYGISQGEEAEAGRPSGVRMVYAAVAAAVGLQIVVGGVMPEFRTVEPVFAALEATRQLIGLTIAAGALVLVHNLYGQADTASRAWLRLPALALAGMWIYELHLHTVGYLSRAPADDLFAMRGAVMAMLVPLFALAIRRDGGWKVQLSRTATFQSLSLLGILLYLIAMMFAGRAIEIVGGEWTRVGQIGIVFVMSLAAMVLLPSGRMRAWMSVVAAKHLFEHRYDYREEWLRFADTIGRRGGDFASIEQRVIKAVADIAGAPGGLLLHVDEQDRLSVAGSWNWNRAVPRLGGSGDGDFLRFVAERFYVVEFAALGRAPEPPAPGLAAELGHAWAGIPVMHGGRLIGLVILDHPPVRRPLDWEDFDLFRTAGIQAASYLAEARSHEALAESQRFEDFNRRFAFIMHDIKNLVSQLSLVARNAERHAGNPEFRADMVATLQCSVKKMNDLLARLSRGNARDAEPPRAMGVRPVLAAIAEARRRLHPVELSGDPGLVAMADPARLEQAAAHLVQNAIEASPPDRPVSIHIGRAGAEIALEIADRGHGMSAEFVRTRLFQPFASTKESGFGVGAYEARELVQAMGGRLEVDSREGEGTRFTIFLPAAETLPNAQQRMLA